MSPLLGLRIAFAGGRDGAARMAVMAVGIATGVALLLFASTAMPAFQSRIDRYAWHRTGASTPATAADPALWLAVTDRYAGQNVIRVHIAPLGPRPPVPPGIDALPGPGEMAVSPALAQLLVRAPRDQLGDRFPGRVTATIGADGLVSPDELVAIVGHTPGELRSWVGVSQISGFEQPGEAIDLGFVLVIAVAQLSVLLLFPVVVFVAMVTRVGAARREQRFAAIRLAGATRGQTGMLAATETLVAAAGGALLGWAGYQLARPLVAGLVRIEGLRFPVEDVVAPTWQVVVVLMAMPLIAVATTLVSLHGVAITPLGTRQRLRRRPPQSTRLIPLTAGIAGVALGNDLASDPAYLDKPAPGLIILASTLLILVGVVLAGPWLCMWISRGLARLSRRPATLIAARRMAADPYAASHSVIAVALAVLAATSLSLAGAAVTDDIDSGGSRVLRPGVVAVAVEGAPQDQLTRLTAPGVVVVVRSAGDRRLAVRCEDLARVTTLTCPLPAEVNERRYPELFQAGGFVEPGPDGARLPVALLLVSTDGTPAAQDRVRTVAAMVVPHSRTRAHSDYEPGAQPVEAELFEGALAGIADGFPLATVFIVIVAACVLTVSLVAGLAERRRPFALLRASGVRLGELRLVGMLETAVPLVVTVLGGVGVALVLVRFATPTGGWILPDAALMVGLGVGLAGAVAISLLTWPLLDAATRHDHIRYE